MKNRSCERQGNAVTFGQTELEVLNGYFQYHRPQATTVRFLNCHKEDVR